MRKRQKGSHKHRLRAVRTLWGSKAQQTARRIEKLFSMLLPVLLLTSGCAGETGHFDGIALESTSVSTAENIAESIAEGASESESEIKEEISGTAAEFDGVKMVIETVTGARISFSCEKAEITGGELLAGCLVTVTFTRDASAGNAVPTVEKTALRIRVDAPPPDPIETAVEETLAEMTLAEKVGQMFIARFPENGGAETLAEYPLGGYILFARDFETRTPEEAAEMIADCQEASKIPLLIGVDEEGGTVNRISKFSIYRASPFLSPQALFRAGGLDAVREDTVEKCRLLKSLGINVNFAPVCDVSENPNDFIYDRSFGQDAESTAQYVETVVTAMREEGCVSVLKHFPGYGNNADTHTGVAYDNRPYETFTGADFLPFQAGIDAGAEVVLVSHNIVSALDPDAPASLSAAVHEILRGELGFDGVVITDDLYMDGVRAFTDDESAAVLAVEAGNDLLCCTDFAVQYPAVLAAVEGGEIAESRIDASVRRILRLKAEMGLYS